jgi:hypothetical protein
VRGTLPKGTVFNAKFGNLGTMCIKDPQGDSWMMIEYRKGDGLGIRFVRTNKAFMNPYWNEMPFYTQEHNKLQHLYSRNGPA